MFHEYTTPTEFFKDTMGTNWSTRSLVTHSKKYQSEKNPHTMGCSYVAAVIMGNGQ